LRSTSQLASNGTIVDTEEKEIHIFVVAVNLQEIIMRLVMTWRDLVNIIHAGVGVIKSVYFKRNSLNKDMKL
jgi:hypothetical protein